MTRRVTSGENPMLLAYDGSEGARIAIERAAELAAGSDALVMTVWRSSRHATPAARVAVPDDLIEGGLERIDAAAADAAATLADEGLGVAREAGLQTEAFAEPCSSGVAGTIADAAEQRGASFIAVGSRGRSELKSIVLGSVAYDLLHIAERPILVVPDHEPQSFDMDAPLLLCYDGSASAGRAIETAARVLRGGPALVAHYWESVDRSVVLRNTAPAALPALEELMAELDRRGGQEAQRVAQEGADLASRAGLAADPIAVSGRHGAWRALTDLARQSQAGAVVVGSRGQSRTRSLVLGSVSQALVQHAGRPVFVVPVARDGTA